MKVYRDIKDVDLIEPVITTGMFDGVHKGHLELITQLKFRAFDLGRPSLVVTFDPHPRLVLDPDAEIELLTSLEERIQRFEESGIDGLLILPFTKELSDLSSFEFLSEVLVRGINMKGFVLGYDHRFGKNRENGYEAYEDFCVKQHIYIEKVGAKKVNDELVSSSNIRRHLKCGLLEDANRLLGYSYRLSGHVVKGVQIGRTIGFPTANLRLSESHKLIPKIGVYAVWVKTSEGKHKGMMNIGYRPTIKEADGKPTIEIHLINFESDLYGHPLGVELVAKLRDEVAFPSLNELKLQLLVDKKNALDKLQ